MNSLYFNNVSFFLSPKKSHSLLAKTHSAQNVEISSHEIKKRNFEKR